MCQTALEQQPPAATSFAARIKREACAQLKLGWPVTFTMILKSAVLVISVIFVGHIGSHELAAAALATLTSNVTGKSAVFRSTNSRFMSCVAGNSLIVGMSGALSTLCAQAYGAKDYETLGVSLQRG